MHAKLEISDTVDSETRSILIGVIILFTIIFICDIVIGERDPHKRLADANMIKSHSYFKGMDWEKLLRKEIPAPFVPSVVSSFHFFLLPPFLEVRILFFK
jgi:hypothetical protein